MKKRDRRTLARWELELIEKRQARRDEIASLNELASRPFVARVIRRSKQASK